VNGAGSPVTGSYAEGSDYTAYTAPAGSPNGQAGQCLPKRWPRRRRTGRLGRLRGREPRQRGVCHQRLRGANVTPALAPNEGASGGGLPDGAGGPSFTPSGAPASPRPGLVRVSPMAAAMAPPPAATGPATSTGTTPATRTAMATAATPAVTALVTSTGTTPATRTAMATAATRTVTALVTAAPAAMSTPPATGTATAAPTARATATRGTGMADDGYAADRYPAAPGYSAEPGYSGYRDEQAPGG